VSTRAMERAGQRIPPGRIGTPSSLSDQQQPMLALSVGAAFLFSSGGTRDQHDAPLFFFHFLSPFPTEGEESLSFSAGAQPDDSPA